MHYLRNNILIALQRPTTAILAEKLGKDLVQQYRGSILLELLGVQALMEFSRMSTEDAVQRGIDIDVDIRDFVEGSMNLGYRFPDDPAFMWAGDAMRLGGRDYRWFSRLRMALREREVHTLGTAISNTSKMFTWQALRSMSAEEYLRMLYVINPGKLDASDPEVLLGGQQVLTVPQVQSGVTRFLFGAYCNETPIWGQLSADVDGSPRTCSIIAKLTVSSLGTLQ